MTFDAKPLSSSNTYTELPDVDTPINIQVRNDLEVITTQIQKLFIYMNDDTPAVERLSTIKLLNKITFHIPSEKKFELSVTSHKTRLVFAAALCVCGLLGFAVGSILASFLLDNPDLTSIATHGLVFGLITYIPVVCSGVCLIRPSNPKNTESQYQKIKLYTDKIIEYTKNIEEAYSAESEDQLRSALNQVFSSDIKLKLRINMINSIIESIHPNSELCNQWRSMSSEIQNLIDKNQSNIDISHSSLGLLAVTTRNLRIESFSKYYEKADFASFKLLGKSNLLKATSFIEELNKLNLMIEKQLNSYWLISSSAIKEKLLPLEIKNAPETTLEELHLEV